MNMKIKEYIKDFCKSHKGRIIGLVSLSVASIIIMITLIIFASLILDRVALLSTTIDKNATLQAILWFNIGVMILIVGVFIVNLFLNKMVNRFGSDIANNITDITYSTLLRGELYDVSNIEVDHLTDSITKSCDKIGNDYIAGRLVKMIHCSISFFGLAIYLFIISSVFALISLFICIIFYWLIKLGHKLLIKRLDEYENESIQRENEVKYNINNLKNIKIRNGIKKEEDEYYKISSDLNRSYNKKSLLTVFNNSLLVNLISGVLISGYLFFLYIQFKTGNDGRIELWPNKTILGHTLAVILTVFLMLNFFKSMLDHYLKYFNIKRDFNSINAILEFRPEARSENINSLEEVSVLKFDHVSFEYSLNDKTVLDKISFELQKGEKLGVLGISKSGKTTLVDMISKIIRPRSGRITINDCDINKLNTGYLRNIIAYVPQNFSLLDGTIEQNIIYPIGLDEYRYNEALNKCMIKDILINLPKRDQELVKDVKLSQSDVCKIALAYAIYKDSPIIILDEVTKQLDQATETKIMSEFYKLKNKMIIVVSDHITNLTKCDKILILKDGKALEYGNVNELANNPRSVYAKIMSEATRKSL